MYTHTRDLFFYIY